jgi:hypothetical protein
MIDYKETTNVERELHVWLVSPETMPQPQDCGFMLVQLRIEQANMDASSRPKRQPSVPLACEVL